ncbi:nitroreductase family protein [Allorhizocola rhizosphaerae]|uniref:nitroreductase family protein n=1 Tax=Allorhizocola rhizosphaerae TaxID=1872709 RepID=UPI000E3E7974|nr:nitroreductase family protein [Allorhizocola rhizosphaerae]
MEFRDVVRRRRMVRRYDPDRAVPEEVVQRLLKHATRAPSAGYSQGWAFLVLRTPQERELFWTATAGRRRVLAKWLEGMRTAPLIIVALSNKSAYLDRYAEADKGWTDRSEARWPVPYWDIDTGMAALMMLLTAVDEGLGACFFGIMPEQLADFKAAFGVPAEYTPVGAVSVGYPAEDNIRGSSHRGRRPLDEVVHFGHWRAPDRLS